MKTQILFRNLRSHTHFIYNGEVYRKQSDAFSTKCSDGSDCILTGKTLVTPARGHFPVRFVK